MPNTPNGRANLASLEATVGGLSNTIAELSRRFEHFAQDVYSKLGQRGVAPGTWLGVVSIVITVAMGVLGAGAIWTSQRITPLENDIARLGNERLQDRRDWRDADRDLRTMMKERDEQAREERKAIREEAKAERQAIVTEFKDIRGSIVSRGEYDQRWNAQVVAMTASERRLDETRKQLAEISSPQDAFKELQRQISELRALVLSGTAKAAAP